MKQQDAEMALTRKLSNGSNGNEQISSMGEQFHSAISFPDRLQETWMNMTAGSRVSILMIIVLTALSIATVVEGKLTSNDDWTIFYVLHSRKQSCVRSSSP